MAKMGLLPLLKVMVEQGASDLHITSGVPPEFRINGRLAKVKMDTLSGQDTKELCYSVLTESQKAEFERNLEVDFSFGIKEIARFRANLFFQRGAVAGVFRRIPLEIPSFESLGLPNILKKVTKLPSGLILVTGPTGSGKSSTLAALLDIINQEERGHILTIEDPIEFVHQHKSCLVNQREVGSDTVSFTEALRRLLRQDPDYILIGELRDIETVEMALTMAETGHLVFATLHTNSAVQSVNRIINVFTPHQQPQIRQLLSFTLQAIFSQQLIPNITGQGLSLAYELLVPNNAIRNLIREDKIHQIYSLMQAGQGETGMQTLNQSLVSLVRQGKISKAEAINYTTVIDELAKMLSSIGTN